MSKTSKAIVAVVPAAGIGSRMQADRPKQYLFLHGKTLLEHTLLMLQSHPAISQVVVAVSKDDSYFDTLPLSKADWLIRVDGGQDRATSVLNALRTLPPDTWALVHDAARPCLLHSDIDALIAQAISPDYAGGILACPVRDTMKRATEGDPQTVAKTESRDNLWHALTPQLFRAGALSNAIEEGLAKQLAITDEASAMEAAGYAVRLVEGNPANIKVTHPADLPLATHYLSLQKNQE